MRDAAGYVIAAVVGVVVFYLVSWWMLAPALPLDADNEVFRRFMVFLVGTWAGTGAWSLLEWKRHHRNDR